MDPAAGPVQRFAFELRKLRTEAGGVTYRVLAQRAGFSVTTLAQAAAGERLPTLPVTLAYVAACDGDVALWEARWQQAVNEVALSQSPAGQEGGRPPYQGLARFEAGDSDRFFGRDKLVADLLELLRGRRFAAVFGPSGSGKSSLLRAGLIPALQHTRDSALRPAAIRVLTPGQHPARSHAQVLGAGPGADGGADVFVIVDQFEEVFTLCPDPVERSHFIDLLLAARQPESRLRVLLSVRADFYGRCAEPPGLADALRDANLLVGPMNPAELRQTIVKPAAAEGLTVERALTTRLVDEVAGQPGGLPLLSHVLLETWRRRRGKALTLAGYEAAGGLDGAVAQTAEALYENFTEAQAAAARQALLRLVAPGSGTPDTRRPADRAELVAPGLPETAEVLEALAQARLLTLDGDTVDLAHEALLTAWPRLRGWIEEDRERLRAHRALTEAARSWEELGRDPGALYRGSRLVAAQEHFGGEQHSGLTALEQEFLTASSAARRREEQAAVRTTRRLRALTATLCVLLVLAVAAGSLAAYQGGLKDEQRKAADRERQVALSRQLAAQSASFIGTHTDLAALLAVQAYRTSPTTQAVESLNAAAAVPLRHRIAAEDIVTSVAFSPDGATLATGGGDGSVRLSDAATGRLRHEMHAENLSGPRTNPSVDAVVFSPDGHTLATVGAYKNGVDLWDVGTGRLRTTLPGPTVSHQAVAFSPDGTALATGSDDGSVQLWDARTGRPRATLSPASVGARPAHAPPVVSVAFDRDGATLATGGDDGSVRLWATSTGRLRQTVRGMDGRVQAMAFSPDGRTLATAARGQAVELWDPRTGGHRRSLGAESTGAVSVAFGPDGHALATASGDDHTIHLWDPHTSGHLATYPGHIDTVRTMAFSPDGRTLATASWDSTVRLWDVTSSPTRALLAGPLKEVSATAFSPDGRTLATASFGRGVDLWNTADRRIRTSLAGAVKEVAAVAFSTDGTTLATGSWDKTVRLWDAGTGRLRTTVGGHTGPVNVVAFAPGGRTLATNDGTVRLWDANTGRLRTTLHSRPAALRALAFSPDGRTLAVGLVDDSVVLWDTGTGRLRTTLRGHTDVLAGVAFGRGGHVLATASWDGTVRLWDVRAGRLRTTLPTRIDPMFGVAFSPDGRTLATASSDTHAVRLWNADTGAVLATLSGHTDTVRAVAFAPDGRTVATGGADQTVRLWNVATPDPTAAISKICRAIKRDLTARERSVYLPDRPPRPTCPTVAGRPGEVPRPAAGDGPGPRGQ